MKMIPDPCASQKIKLKSLLPDKGWQIKSIITPELDWWVAEYWVIESTWSPKGTQVIINFLVDPMTDINAPAMKKVWAISATSSVITSLNEVGEGIEIQIRNHFDEEVDAFVSKLRDFNND